MAVAFSSSADEVLRRAVGVSRKLLGSASQKVEEIFELQRCASWIRTNGVQRVALQFPDELLSHSVGCVEILTSLVPETKLYILGDTSFGSCCIDEVAAHHASCDAIIHFGHSCLSAPSALKALLVFGVHQVDWQPFKTKLNADIFWGEHLLVFVDTKYCSHLDILEEILPRCAVIGKPVLPGDPPPAEGHQIVLKRCFNTKEAIQTGNNLSILWIGEENMGLTGLILRLNSCGRIWSYNPESTELREEGLTISRSLMRRHYLVERAKDANIIGILVGTLGVKNFRQAIEHLRTLIKSSGKRSYTLAVGKLNVAKLANFQEIDIFVYVACPENTFFDSKEFYRPVITPYELEVALNPNRRWGAQYFTDFDDILTGGCAHVAPPEDFDRSTEYDISLISGRIRGLGGGSEKPAEDHENTASGALVRKEQTVSVVHIGGAGDALSQRSWRGLDPQVGETPVTAIKRGRDGIAMGYTEEAKHDVT